MIHGSLYAVPVSQAEQFFVALSRFNKRAKLVRYIGERHRIQSPANIIDMWQQIFGWFDKYLRGPESATKVSK
jgi:dipeptidyl aminopeptidase/acylaminoacyl peptidase